MKVYSNIESISVGPRQSNFELLRIMSMFLVLIVHASFWANGAPSLIDFEEKPLSSITLTFFESISIVCVNVFVLISGWFGIKSSFKGFCGFIFQCLYFAVGLYIITVILGCSQFSPKDLTKYILFTPSSYWFIVAYSALYILSPVLNVFIKNASKKRFRYTLLCFFVFQTIWGFTGIAGFISLGYSCFSFIGLYLLAGYLRIFGIGKLTHWGGIYAISVILNVIGYYIFLKLDLKILYLSYVNPVVIAGASGLLLFFNSLKISTNKLINWVAKSAFAVYLLHCNPYIFVNFFKDGVNKIYSDESGFVCLIMTFIFLLLVYFIAIILDQPRKWLWNICVSVLKS